VRLPSAHQLGVEAVIAERQQRLLALHQDLEQDALAPQPMEVAKRLLGVATCGK
jgi:hypothetical protein